MASAVGMFGMAVDSRPSHDFIYPCVQTPMHKHVCYLLLTKPSALTSDECFCEAQWSSNNWNELVTEHI